jgi:hypothetical protein
VMFGSTLPVLDSKVPPALFWAETSPSATIIGIALGIIDRSPARWKHQHE